MFMSEYDVTEAGRRFLHNESTPNLSWAVQVLGNLIGWTNRNSDGWAYWPKPTRAAQQLQTLIGSVDRFNPQDVTEAQVKAALRPVKAFLTRQGVDHAGITA